jgi:5-oxopent-3-ene-1,2,5-tricarboxylate decarboxylase / 2-hydroxyhepta-2,4-diene-1,7-dioate isomerase
MTGSLLSFSFAPYRLTGTVYGVLLNHAGALAALGDAVHARPYLAPPTAPVLYVKPRNTLSVPGQPIEVPEDVQGLMIGANLGAVIGRTACRVVPEQALSYVAGYVIVNDLSVPHENYFRPSIRFIACDGTCSIGPSVVDRARIADPDALSVRIHVDGRLMQTTDTSQRLRPLARLIADVTDFMTLAPGDILMLGASAGAPTACAGQRVSVTIDGLGQLDNPLVAERASVDAGLS